MKKRIIQMALFVAVAAHAMAQAPDTLTPDKKPLKALEFGIGGSVLQFNRAAFSNFSQSAAGYLFNLKLDHAVYGGNLYIARELNTHFYLDLQGTVGATGNRLNSENKAEWLCMLGPGLQWRLGEYFGSRYIDPYLRAGINYMHKDFEIIYAGAEGLLNEQMEWALANLKNKWGADRKNLAPISLGAGLNMWLNDRWGIGMQGDYLVMPYKDVANSMQGTVRVMYRMGGKSKKAQPAVQYVDRVVEVEKTVEKIVEKLVEKPVTAEMENSTETSVPITRIIEKFFMLEDICFDFDKADIRPESDEILDKLAGVMISDTSRRYLITGYTDSKGSNEYNMQLSRKRAESVVKALAERGVPAAMMKARGVGSRIAYVKPVESNEVRFGDRKITIEPISNKVYWDYLPGHSF